MDHTKIEKILKEEGYPFYMIEQTVEKIDNLQPAIKDCFEKWVKDGVYPEIEIEGFTFRRFIEEQDKTAVAAFLALDWLIRDPQAAKVSLSRKTR